MPLPRHLGPSDWSRGSAPPQTAHAVAHDATDGWSEDPSIGELTWASGWGGAWEPMHDDSPGLYPDLDELDAEARRALLASLTTDDS